MDKSYDFGWLINDIDSSFTLVLRHGSEMLGNYQVSRVLANDFTDISIRFANINDLEHFINYAYVRFIDVIDSENFIDIPVRKLNMLFSHCSVIGQNHDRSIGVEELDAFVIYDGASVGKDYTICVYRVRDASDSLMDIVEIAESYANLSMDEKINALEKVNLINYQKEDGKKLTKT